MWRNYGHTHGQQQQFNSIGHVVLVTTPLIVKTRK